MTTEMHAEFLYPKEEGLARKVSRFLLPIGVTTFFFGVFIYLLGNVRLGPIQWFYQNIVMNQGIARLFRTSPAILSQSVNNFSKYSVFWVLAGLLVAGNGIMLRIQPWERYKDSLCVQPALALLFLFSYYPMAEIVRMSFTDITLMTHDYKFVGFTQYTWLFHGSGGWFLPGSLKLTGRYILWESVSMIGGGMFLALLFSGLKTSGKIMRALITLPRFITITSSATVFIWMLSTPYGVMNHMLSLFGIAGPIWMHTESFSFQSVLFLSIWRCLGYGMILFFSAMQRIPAVYYEAARIEGANRMRCFRMVTLPSLKPLIHCVFCLTLVNSLKAHETFELMKGGRPDSTPTAFPLWISTAAFLDYRIDHAAAISVMYFLVFLIVMLVTMRFVFKLTDE